MNKRRILVSILALAIVISAVFAVSIAVFAAEDSFEPLVSITLADDLIFNIYVPASDELSSLSLNGEDIAIESLSKNSDGYFHIALPLDAPDACEDITLSVTLERGGKELFGRFTYSVAGYAERIIASDESETVKDLARDILAYVKSAAEYFGNSVPEKLTSVLGNYNRVTELSAPENSPLGMKGATFVLEDSPAVRFYLENGYDADGFRFFVNGKEVAYTLGSDEDGDYLQIKLYAYLIRTTVKYTYSTETREGCYNLSSYIDYVKNEYSGEGKDALLALVTKLYAYSLGADEYRTEVIRNNCNHSYQSSVKREPTPTVAGSREYLCSLCGNKYEERIPTELKLLTIGNSFSQDAVEHLYLIAKDAGIENVLIGNVYKGGCSLDTHYNNLLNGTVAYTFYYADENTKKITKDPTSRDLEYCIGYAEWDIVTIQQASNQSGVASNYSNLDAYVAGLRELIPEDALLFWHMTWAYQSNSDHSGFANYDNNQMNMYNAIVSVVENVIEASGHFDGVIPSGTSVQNLRTSTLGDTLTRDGYHLSHGIGRYTAALTYLAALTGMDISGITAYPESYPEVAEYLDHIKDAVAKAIAEPKSVTESAYPQQKTLLNSTISSLTADDIAYLELLGYDPDDYMVLDFEWTENSYYNSTTGFGQYHDAEGKGQHDKFLATQKFSREEIVCGSIIRLDEGYRYRPEAWVDLSTKNTSSKRPKVTTESTVVVDDAWWGDFNYRAFNLGKAGEGTLYMGEEDALKIYIPIVTRGELTADDRAYLESKGLNADEYKVLEIETSELNRFYNSSQDSNIKVGSGNVLNKFLTTEMFTKYDLTIGSVIRITTNDNKYRPEGWITLSTKNSTRPTEVKTDFVMVDAAWWGAYNYRAFNIGVLSGTIEEADAASLRIYIKVS